VINFGRCADDKPYVPIYQVSKEKAKSLGIEFIPLEDQGNRGKLEGERIRQFLSISCMQEFSDVK